MPRPPSRPDLEALRRLAAGEMDEDPSDNQIDPQSYAQERTPYREARPAYGSHRGPAMDRYLALDENLEREAVGAESDTPLPGSMDRLRGRYADARREAALKGATMPALFDEEAPAPPSTAAPHAAGFQDLPAFQGGYMGHRGPAMEEYSGFAGDTGDIQTAEAERMRALLYGRASREAALKGVTMPESMVDNPNVSNPTYVAARDTLRNVTDRNVDEELDRFARNRERAGERR